MALFVFWPEAHRPATHSLTHLAAQSASLAAGLDSAAPAWW